jgi:hypothetical protein
MNLDNLKFNKKVVNRAPSAHERPFIKVNSESGRVSLSSSIITALDLETSKFNYAVDTETNSIFLYICNSGWKNTKGTKSFVSTLFSDAVKDHFNVEPTTFELLLDLTPVQAGETSLYKLSFAANGTVENTLDTTLPLNSGDIAVEQQAAEEAEEDDDFDMPTFEDTMDLVKEQQEEEFGESEDVEIEEDELNSFEL